MSVSAPALDSPAERKNFYRAVFSLVLPMALQNLINVAVQAADVMMLGRVSEKVLSGASLAGQVAFILNICFFGITSGASVLASQYWGKGQRETIDRILGIALRFSLVAAFLFTVLGFCFPAFCLSVFTGDPEVIAEGAKYLRILSLSFLLSSVTMTYLNVIRSLERVVVSMVTYLISLCCNVLLNALLIFGLFGFPEMGIEGAAVATLTARAVELFIVLIYAGSKKSPLRLSVKNIFVRDKVLFFDYVRYSAPVVLNELAWGGGASMTAAIVGHLGSSVVAANSVTQVTRQLAMVVGFGLANAAAVLIGKAIGANDEEKAKLYGRRFTRLSVVFGLCSALVILPCIPAMLHFMVLSDESRRYLIVMMLMMTYFVFLQNINSTVIVGICRAGGDTAFGLIADVGTMWLFSIVLGAVGAFVFRWPVPVVYALLLSDEVIKLPLIIWRYKSRKWLKNVTR